MKLSGPLNHDPHHIHSWCVSAIFGVQLECCKKCDIYSIIMLHKQNEKDNAFSKCCMFATNIIIIVKS